MFKTVKKEMWITVAIYIAIGLILMLWPDTTARIVSYIIASLLVVTGAYLLFKYFKQDLIESSKGYDFTIGSIIAVIGIIVYIKPTLVINIFPLFLGFVVLVSGVVKLQNSIDVARAGFEKWWTLLLLALVNIVVAIVIIVNPFETATLLIRIVGGCFMYVAITDIISTLCINGKIEAFKKEFDEYKMEDE